jgi:very-short-patch-repair endonuclease
VDEDLLQRIRNQQLAYEMRTQLGVATWQQLRDGGWTEDRIRSAQRRRELRRILPRTYVNHTGELTRAQQEWAAVAWAAPAAVIPGFDDDLVHLAITSARRLSPQEGVRIHRIGPWEAALHPRSEPPRLRFEHALLIRAGAAVSDSEAVAIVIGGIGRRGVATSDLRQALELHPRLRRRALLTAVIEDAAAGTESVLERGYLVKVERAHGLPTPLRQSPRPGERRDMEYPLWNLVIELDGRLGHDTWADGQKDAQRDLSDVAAGKSVLRLRWRQVMENSCRTAMLVSQALTRRGWTGTAHGCSAACPLVLGASLSHTPGGTPQTA